MWVPVFRIPLYGSLDEILKSLIPACGFARVLLRKLGERVGAGLRGLCVLRGLSAGNADRADDLARVDEWYAALERSHIRQTQ